MSKPYSDAGIPLLTEVIDALPDTAAEAPAATPAPPAAPAELSGAELEQQALAGWSDEQWKRMERHIRERILRQILARTDAILEQRVRDTLADVLQTAVEALANEIRGQLHRSLEEVVERAVSQEITRLQASRKS